MPSGADSTPAHAERPERSERLREVFVVGETNGRERRLCLLQCALSYCAFFEQPCLQGGKGAETRSCSSLVFGEFQDGVRSRGQCSCQREHGNDAADVAPPGRESGGRPPRGRFSGPRRQSAATE